MSILSKWRHTMTDMGLEPTSVLTKKEVRAYYKKLSLSIHPDKCHGCSSEHKIELTVQMAKLNDSFNFLNKNFYDNPEQEKVLQNTFNDYLHSNTDRYFSNTEISVEGNELLLGKLYYAFGLDSF